MNFLVHKLLKLFGIFKIVNVETEFEEKECSKVVTILLYIFIIIMILEKLWDLRIIY